MKKLEKKREEKLFYKTNFGPEETQDYIIRRINLANQKKALINNELRKQIEVNTI